MDSWGDIRSPHIGSRRRPCPYSSRLIIHEIIQGSRTKVADIVPNKYAKRLTKIEGEGVEAVAARAAITRNLVPAGQITAATLEQQFA